MVSPGAHIIWAEAGRASERRARVPRAKARIVKSPDDAGILPLAPGHSRSCPLAMFPAPPGNPSNERGLEKREADGRRRTRRRALGFLLWS